MSVQTFVQLVRQHFNYLIDEYGFSVIEKMYSEDAFSDGIIEFWSSTTFVSIQKIALIQCFLSHPLQNQ